jgi:hypothetical protein
VQLRVGGYGFARGALRRAARALRAIRYRGNDGIASVAPSDAGPMPCKSGIPIIFVQVGDFMNVGAKRFADIALQQAASASPDSDVILLTDEPRPHLPGIVQVRLGTHHHAAVRFKKLYRHASINDPRYELLCFTRWFYIRDFVQRHGIERFCIFDCDILLFSPVETFAAAFGKYQLGNWSWANVISSHDALDAICGYFERVFRDRGLLARITEKYRNVTDMGALMEFGQTNPLIFDQRDLPAMGFDNNINIGGPSYVMKDGIKSLTIGADGIPMATRADDGAEVPFHFLHFQGSAKDLMAKFAWRTVPDVRPA